jgi:hypothetical protein
MLEGEHTHEEQCGSVIVFAFAALALPIHAQRLSEETRRQHQIVYGSAGFPTKRRTALDKSSGSRWGLARDLRFTINDLRRPRPPTTPYAIAHGTYDTILIASSMLGASITAKPATGSCEVREGPRSVLIIFAS